MKYILLICALTLATSADAEQRARGQRSSSSQKSQPTPRAEALSRNVPPKMLLPAGSDRFDRYGKPVPPSSFHRHRWPVWMYVNSPYAGGGYYSGYGDYYPEESAQQAPEPPPASVTSGFLRLEITPMTGLLYYVDGVYFGSSADLGTQFEITAGGRRVEIRAQGYKPLAFNTRITPGAIVTFRGALEPEAAAPTVVRPAGNPTMYIIPGCYMGNARPNPAALPKGCDAQKLITR